LSSVESFRRQLLEGNLLDQEGLKKAESAAQSRGQPLERAIVQLGLADEGAVWRTLAKAHGLKYVDPVKLAIQPDALQRIPKEQLEQNEALPVLLRDGVLWVAIDDPQRTFVADNLGFFAGCAVRCALMPPTALRAQLRKVTGGEDAAQRGGRADKAAAGEGDDAPIIRLVQRTVDEALEARASDIHIEPFAQRIRVRYRVDGVLREQTSLDAALLGPLTSRLKIMAGLDIAE
jgi:type II secretory ATPase GspE/PulE/Tfp pilus assembly ATPase PilB-like protein